VLQAWQKKNVLFYLLLVPLSWLFAVLVALRHGLYKFGIFKSYALSVPTVVVGNINLGGSGKTPVVIWLVEQLKQNGFNPGVISRGYGANVKVPISVTASSLASEVGDEPLLIARRCLCPVFVGKNRVASGQMLINSHPECNVIISDDGLQHYRLKRDFEIAVVNQNIQEEQWLLPAGPKRESVSRLKTVDAVVFNGKKNVASEFEMQLVGAKFYNLQNPQLNATSKEFADKKIKAIAAIGNPERFFEHLRNLGLPFTGIGFDDHHAFSLDDLASIDCEVLIMTEKDAVKCQAFAQAHHWVLPVEANIDPSLITLVLEKITKK
jgi:tetraacyldisaccharide 4'-kinase